MTDPFTETGEDAFGVYTGTDNGETGEDTGYPAPRSAGSDEPKPADEPGTKPSTPDDDESEHDDTDEDGEKVDTSDIGYDIPTGGKEPSA